MQRSNWECAWLKSAYRQSSLVFFVSAKSWERNRNLKWSHVAASAESQNNRHLPCRCPPTGKYAHLNRLCHITRDTEAMVHNGDSSDSDSSSSGSDKDHKAKDPNKKKKVKDHKSGDKKHKDGEKKHKEGEKKKH
uniref:Uncharacterized protein n=1 Tax=Plectus sambesii TaxID=2011161 RepID=A0A914VP21_9BILA